MLETMRETLSRFGWTKADLDDRGRETYFPPDRLPASGITLDCRRGGTWERIGSCCRCFALRPIAMCAVYERWLSIM